MAVSSPTQLTYWFYVAVAIAIAVAANTVATKWSGQVTWNGYLPTSGWANAWMIPMVVLSVLVFVTFGRVSAAGGLANTSAIIDSSLTIATMVVGLIFLKEWKTTSLVQYAGMVLVVGGIILIKFFPAPSPT